LLQRTTLKSPQSQPRLSFNMENLDDVFPGFAPGDFAVLHGSPTVLPLSMLLCVRAQLPPQLGGLGTNVTFVDGGNTFRLYDVSTLAQAHELDPKGVLERIFISRAFTAYQMTSIVFDRLRETVEQHDSKLVVVSDIAGLYLDKDVPEREAKHVFSQLTLRLSRFAEKNHVTVIATYPPHYASKRNLFLKWAACGRANVVASVRPTRHSSLFVLEKHPLFPLRRAAFPSENLTLSRFMEA
jgi:predicted ATP-dependent serine protease